MWQSVLSTIALLPVFLYPSALAVIDPYLPTNNADIFDQSAVESDDFNQHAAQGPASTNDALEYQDMLDVQGESEVGIAYRVIADVSFHPTSLLFA